MLLERLIRRRAGLQSVVRFLLLLPIAAAQLLDPKPSVQHATFSTSSSQSRVAPGSTIALWLDVVPKPKNHIYGTGADKYLPIALTVAPRTGAKAGSVSYPKPEVVFFPALDERTPVYSRPFRLTQSLTVSKGAKPGDVWTIFGVVKYQACDDSICYAPSSAHVSWTLQIDSPR
jgi:DsbC/DsbD-like thiol-disulfide interchange protein